MFNNLFAQAEAEFINYDTDLLGPLNVITTDKRITVDGYLLGAGYRQQIGRRAYLNFLVLWNFNESVYTLYDNPIIRAGIEIDL